MEPTISVIICTHNPRPSYLARVLESLKQQTLDQRQWELFIIDNASQELLASQLDLSWHPRATVVREELLGLTMARLCGFRVARGKLIVYVDDDNILDANYLTHVAQIFATHDHLGAIAGKSIPEFEVEPEPWIKEFHTVLALRDFGDKPLVYEGMFGALISDRYPEFAPAGIGLSLRRSAFSAYVQRVTTSQQRLTFGRSGKQLTSGEDNDIVLTLLSAGWGVGYFPELQITHLISRNRLTCHYLARLNYATFRSWVQVLDVHGIRPWKKIPTWTVLPRKLKAFFRHQPWRNPSAYVQWRGTCGLLEGQAILS